MHLSHLSRPCPGTIRYVRYYVQREAQLGISSVNIPVLARACSLLDFEFGNPIEIHSSNTDLTRRCETAALVGLETCVQNRLLISGNFESFAIHFQPLALNHLFGLPGFELTDCNHAAHAVLGSAISKLKQRLGEARSFEERVRLADQFIAAKSVAAPIHDSIELAADEIVRNKGRCRIDLLAHQTGFSMRSFQRLFRERVGASPKLYSRILRFEAALKMKAASRHVSWTTVAQESGYHDQMHLIHDFRQFSEGTPTRILGGAGGVFAPQIESAAQGTRTSSFSSSDYFRVVTL